MASLESRNGKYSVVFRFGGRKFMRALGTSEEGDAEESRLKVERRIRFVEDGTLTIPDGANVADFLLGKTKTEKQGKRVTLKSLLDSFFESLSEGSLEESTVDTMEIHKRHLLRVIGGRLDVELLNLGTLDAYAKKRTKEKIRGRTAGANTIRKELTTLRRVWMWGQKRGKVQASFPAIKDVALPKTKELPPFQAWEEIEPQVDGLEEQEAKELWDCLFLRQEEIKELLEHVNKSARHGFSGNRELTDHCKRTGHRFSVASHCYRKTTTGCEVLAY